VFYIGYQHSFCGTSYLCVHPDILPISGLCWSNVSSYLCVHADILPISGLCWSNVCVHKVRLLLHEPWSREDAPAVASNYVLL
jgi:hypothetical protein